MNDNSNNNHFQFNDLNGFLKDDNDDDDDDHYHDWGASSWQDLHHQQQQHEEEEEEDTGIDIAPIKEEEPQEEEEEDTEAIADAALSNSAPVQQQQQQQQHQKEEAEAPTNSTTTSVGGVDGIGMWKSWTHNYEQPRFACFDLLDNCFDATLHSQVSHGKVVLKSVFGNGMVIMNNSYRPIQSLQEILTAYRSEKNNSSNGTPTAASTNGGGRKDAIGEYGVGLKQACATLSNTSFVLTRNKHVFDFGVIAESLQTKHNVSFPHYSFEIDDMHSMNSDLLDQELYQRITNYLEQTNNTQLLQLVTLELGGGNRKDGIQALVDRFKVMCTDDDEWKDHNHVFQLVLTNLIHTRSNKHSSSNGILFDSETQRNHRAFLEEIRHLLPQYYINIPLTTFSFHINDKKVLFSYWQHRLVEMTKFQVNVPKETPIKDLDDPTCWFQQGYPLSIYCGFDSLRVDHGKQPKTCQLNIYSRKSGRLITVENDARAMLGLASSGVDFSQGLTVIIDDVGGELPLKPTKDGITWSKDAKGEAHKQNLLAWTGAVAYLYWKYHASIFEKRCESTECKKLLLKAVRTFVEPIKKRLAEQERMARENVSVTTLDASWNYERLEKANFTMFNEVNWTMTHTSNDMKLKIRKTSRMLHAWPGPATVFKFDDTHYPSKEQLDVIQEAKTTAGSTLKRPRGRPPRAKVARTSNKRKRGNLEESSSSGSEAEEEEVLQVSKVARRANSTPCIRSKTMATKTTKRFPGRAAVGTSVRTYANNNNTSNTTTTYSPEHAGGDSANTKENNDSSKILLLEQQVQELQNSLQQARKQLMQQSNHSRGAPTAGDSSTGADSGRLSENLQAAFEKITLLKARLLETEERRVAEVAELKNENERLKQELKRQQEMHGRQKQDLLHTLSLGRRQQQDPHGILNGVQPQDLHDWEGLWEGTDEI